MATVMLDACAPFSRANFKPPVVLMQLADVQRLLLKLMELPTPENTASGPAQRN